MIKALFLDFYGTIVHEDGEVIKKISQIIYDTGNADDISDIGRYWWDVFQKSFTASHGDSFSTQRELEYRSLKDTISHFGSSADAAALSEMMFCHWIKPPLFADAAEFLRVCPYPVYIVSNIDTDDIIKAADYHGLCPAGIFTSEDARAYKPDSALFEYALKHTGLRPCDVIHIGDSLSSDVKGAENAGIRAVWLNRSGRAVPAGVTAITMLTELPDIMGKDTT